MLRRAERRLPISGRAAWIVAIAVGGAVASSFLGIAPVRSQTVEMEALQVEEPVAITEPWASVWDGVPSQEVPLSAQNIAPPFGGGTISAVVARALHDGQRLYLVLEWQDDQPDDSVIGNADFSDAAAVQFPVVAETATPYTMGGRGTPVNIWQWKAVWQADIDSGFETTATAYPNTYVDFYPDPGDPIFRPAEQVGNPLAQRSRVTPIENLVAEGFGTLTNAGRQDVEGSGEWRDGRWRALFARDLEPAGDGVGFAVGETTPVAFAIWNGSAGDRDGQKSIAQFIDLSLGSQVVPLVVPDAGEGTGVSMFAVLASVAVVLFLILLLGNMGSQGRDNRRLRPKEVSPEE